MERTRVLTHLPSLIWNLIPIFLYAETHYRFKYFFSFLRKREPEIIADAPHRLDPNSSLPILILVKDADLFPAQMTRIVIVLKSKETVVCKKSLLNLPVDINQKLWWRVFEIDVDGLSGTVECDVLFEIRQGNRKRIYHNDNHRTSSHNPLKVFLSPSSLPRFPHLHFGECHSHSTYTDDQVEFGSPLGASVHLCKPIGISFFCVTDHSYDLDDTISNYLVNDPNLSKWEQLQNEVNDLNSMLYDFSIIRGEEVTCLNSAKRNVHLLLLGTKRFFAGKGDGAEQWFKTQSEYFFDEILREKDLFTLAYAAHPREPVSFLERLLLHRGTWSERDIANPNLSGIQFANGQLSGGFKEGYHQWINALLQGRRLFALAGNDAHGNFNRFRQIGIPFIKIREMEHQLFGKMRTGVFVHSLSEDLILNSIRSGMSILTDGPVANMRVLSSINRMSSLGCTYSGSRHTVLLEILSSNEYGSIESFKVLRGNIGHKETEFVFEKQVSGYSLDLKFSFTNETESYIRAEIWTSAKDSSDGQPHFCITNPIWFTQKQDA